MPIAECRMRTETKTALEFVVRFSIGNRHSAIIRPHRPAVRTPDFRSGNKGSIPFGVTTRPERTVSGAKRPVSTRWRALRVMGQYLRGFSRGRTWDAEKAGNQLRPFLALSAPKSAPSLSVSPKSGNLPAKLPAFRRLRDNELRQRVFGKFDSPPEYQSVLKQNPSCQAGRREQHWQGRR